MPVMETQRLYIREFEISDLDALHEMYSDPQVMRYLDDLQPHASREQTLKVIEEAQASYLRNGYGAWAFVSKEDGRLVGFGGLERFPGRSNVEVAYSFGRDSWGKGFATEVAGAIINYGFEELGLPDIGASIDPGNAASIRVAEKSGMSYVENSVDQYGLPIVLYSIKNQPSSG